jgi:hypothetical protein
MGLKGYRLWAMGQLDSTCRAPPPRPAPRSVVAQVEFERGTFETRIGIQREGFETSRFQAYGSTWFTVHRPTAQPSSWLVGKRERRSERCFHAVALQVAFERQILKPVFSLDRL